MHKRKSCQPENNHSRARVKQLKSSLSSLSIRYRSDEHVEFAALQFTQVTRPRAIRQTMTKVGEFTVGLQDQ